MKPNALFHGLVLLSAGTLLAGCLRLSVDEDRVWACKDDGDCEGGTVCKFENSYPYDGECRPRQWCASDDHCAEEVPCDVAQNRCVDFGGEAGGACREVSDCGPGLQCVFAEERDGSTSFDYLGTCTCTPSAERCNGVDDDCDGLIDEDFDLGAACSAGACGIGVRECGSEAAIPVCSTGKSGSDFDPSLVSEEQCNGIDDDCDGSVDEGLDAERQTCGVGMCERTVSVCSGGAEQSCMPGDPAPDVCDGLDNDCSGVADDDKTYWYNLSEEVAEDLCGDITWQRAPRGFTTELDEAVAYCDQLDLAGYDDWRLPTRDEAASLLGCSDGECKSCWYRAKCKEFFDYTNSTNVYIWAEGRVVADFGRGQVFEPGSGSYGANAICVRDR